MTDIKKYFADLAASQETIEEVIPSPPLDVAGVDHGAPAMSEDDLAEVKATDGDRENDHPTDPAAFDDLKPVGTMDVQEPPSAAFEHAPIRVHTSLGLESVALQLKADLSDRLVVADTSHVSAESQQMQVAEHEALVHGIEDELAEYASKHPSTGPVHVYLLDGQALASGDEDNQATLHALINSSINDPKHTVAALLPETVNGQPVPPTGAAKNTTDVIKQFLTDGQAIPAVESYEGLLTTLREIGQQEPIAGE